MIRNRALRVVPASYAALLLTLGLAAFDTAAAQQPSQAQISAIRSACRSDFMSHCANVQPGGADALRCLQRNVAQLSAPCQTAVNAASPKPKPAATTAAPAGGPAPAAAPTATAPAQPASTPTAAAPSEAPAAQPPGTARPAARRTQQGTATAAPPATAPAAGAMVIARPVPVRVELMILRESCGPDYRALCSAVQPGGGRALSCLAANGPRLSPACRTALASLARR